MPSVIQNPVRSRTHSRVVVAVRPLGCVPFDAMTLPLTSPDGRFIATQSGATPSWETVLAQSTAVPPGLSISAYRVDMEAPLGEEAIALVEWGEALPRGLLLGRSCDDEGFLVEAPREGPGAARERWIGKVEWRTGHLQWLVAPPQASRPNTPAIPTVAAFASFGPGGELAYCRRASIGSASASASGRSDLVIRRTQDDAANEFVLADTRSGESYICPTFSADADRVYAVALPSDPAAGMSVVVVPLAGPALRVSSRVNLDMAPDLAAAYHVVSTLQTPWPIAESALPQFSGGIAIFSSSLASMVWLNANSATLTPLARGTLGAAPFIAPGSDSSRWDAGLLLGAAKELVFQAVATREEPNSHPGPEFGAEVPVISGPLIPRLTTAVQGDGAPVYLLLSPPRAGQPEQVEVLVMSPVRSPEEPSRP